MDPDTTLVLTHDLRVILKNVQLNTRIEIFDLDKSQSVTLDMDRWDELKKSIETIDKEFYKRVHVPYSSF